MKCLPTEEQLVLAFAADLWSILHDGRGIGRDAETVKHMAQQRLVHYMRDANRARYDREQHGG